MPPNSTRPGAVRVVWYTLVSRDRRFSLFWSTKTQTYAPGRAKNVTSQVTLPGLAKKAGKR